MSEHDALIKTLAEPPQEPLLPVEKKLIAWSLGIGITLLVILGVINHFFPATSL